jgi:hypothetical protein
MIINYNEKVQILLKNPAILMDKEILNFWTETVRDVACRLQLQ